MSIPDRTGAARNFVLASRTGLDATYVCTNPLVGDSIQVLQRQTRPAKAGQMVSVNAKCIVGYTDPTTGSSYPVEANLTVRFRNDDRVSLYAERVQQATVIAIRSLTPYEVTGNSIVGTTTETNLKNALLGALPTP